MACPVLYSKGTTMSDPSFPEQIATKDPLDEKKNIISALAQNFVKAEAGNRVTENNVGYFVYQIMLALDGQITLTPPEEGK